VFSATNIRAMSQQAPLKRRQTSTRLYGATTQKTAIFKELDGPRKFFTKRLLEETFVTEYVVNSKAKVNTLNRRKHVTPNFGIR
jgi:hypothetical protein